ncbi:hypothetical protein AG1IA_06080 [Rhizoctonia solani AG-1 IA]|uniref:Uncharacterized protein n=1 Tax=Thanatephorus cucumeris (strain AG1-IA) TaxID=983506 RepID=L8WSX1_THACA|nr:hypothetical protein AG1IA_06080 [Rhizoctonia solani AG-1 IA]
MYFGRETSPPHSEDSSWFLQVEPPMIAGLHLRPFSLGEGYSWNNVRKWQISIASIRIAGVERRNQTRKIVAALPYFGTCENHLVVPTARVKGLGVESDFQP